MKSLFFKKDLGSFDSRSAETRVSQIEYSSREAVHVLSHCPADVLVGAVECAFDTGGLPCPVEIL